MAIVHDTKANTITLHSRNTTYQMQIGENGHLLHLYYGKKIEDCCLNYRLVLTDCGFSPNSYEARYRRDISLDVLPQEYSSANSGDFRVPALECVNGNGVVGTDLRYQGHEIRRGKYALPGLPAAFSNQDEAQTLSVTLRDDATGLTVELLYGVFEDADMLTRAVVIRNDGSHTTYQQLNLADTQVFNSPYFYLQQNDVVYVAPNRIRIDNSKYNQNNAYKLSVISTIVSAVSVVASLVIDLAVK